MGEVMDYIYALLPSLFRGLTTTLEIFLITLILSIPLGIFIGIKKEKRDSDIAGNKRRKADRLAKKYLSEAWSRK